MARPLRCQYAGAIYHVTTRGNERRAVFHDDADRKRFLEKLQELAQAHSVCVYAYALMPNHYHLVVCTPHGNLSAFMQQFNTSYTVYFNRRHRRIGHLFAGRFKARLVEGGSYLLALTRYVHLNPVKMKAARGMALEEKVRLLRGYPWSSYRSYAGLDQSTAWVDYDPLRAFRDIEAAARRAAYGAYVEDKIAEDDDALREAMTNSSKAIGAEDFRLEVERRFRDARPNLARWVDISRRRVETRLDADLVLSALAVEAGLDPSKLCGRGNGEYRDVLIRLWREECGMTNREIGRRLGHADGATIGKRLRILALPEAQEHARSVMSRRQSVLRRIANCKA